MLVKIQHMDQTPGKKFKLSVMVLSETTRDALLRKS